MLSNGKEDEQLVNVLQTSDLGTILDQTTSSCTFLHFPSSVSKLKGKLTGTEYLWNPQKLLVRAIIPRIKPSICELVPYLPWKSNLFSEITEKRKLFKLILNMFPFISNTKIAFELSYSFPTISAYIHANYHTDFPSLSTLHISETVGRPLGGCCPDSCAISWENQLIKETKKMQKLLETDSCLQHCSAPLYVKSTASTRWNRGACKSMNELLHM